MRRKIARKVKKEIIAKGGIIKESNPILLKKEGYVNGKKIIRGYSVIVEYGRYTIDACGKDELDACRLGLECLIEAINGVYDKFKEENSHDY